MELGSRDDRKRISVYHLFLCRRDKQRGGEASERQSANLWFFVCRLYKSVAESTAKEGYRADLRREAVARASALKKANRPVKEGLVPKLRGKKALAKAVAEKEKK